MSFAPGDEVVCVDDGPPKNQRHTPYWARGERGPELNAHYTIRSVSIHGVQLTEIVNPRLQYREGVDECSYCPSRFRKVERKNIELFRAMCTSTKPLVEV